MGREKLTGNHFVKQRGDGIYIGCLGKCRGILQHLRRREMQGHIHLRIGVHGTPQTEISDLRNPVLIEQDAEIVEVAVDEFRVVGMGETLANRIDNHQ